MTVQITGRVTGTPLTSLSAEEIRLASQLLRDAGHVTESTRFAYVGLLEPHKTEVLAALAGTGPVPDRRARVFLLDTASGASLDATVNLATRAVTAAPVHPSRGQLPILIDEFASIDPIVRADDGWVAALARRGLAADEVATVPLSPGHYENPGEEGRRIIRVFAFQSSDPADHPWAHPVDGLCAYVDVIARQVIRVLDAEMLPVPPEPSKFHLEEGRPAPLAGLKPIEITQPEGPSFIVDGDRVTWANWSFGIGFDAREGLVLHNLAFADPDHGGEVRPVIYRASIAEMVVPYADPSPTRYWQNYFDTGEYIFGRFANSLRLGCDCLGEIRYFDVTLADEFGNPQTIGNAVCMHEEDFGTLWKHTDLFVEGVSEVRRQRRLVVSFFTTVGNYDYGFYWYLYLDGKIECEAKLTGILFPSAYKGMEEWPYATEVAPGLGAPFHQHLFSARLDMMVDGPLNAVDEVEAVRVPVSESNPWGNAFTYSRTRIASEADAARSADASTGRAWHIVSTERTNRLGQPTAYLLKAEQNPTLLADPGASVTRRAAYATRQVWVTAYSPNERYPAGEFVNQNPGGDGLPAYQAAGRDLDGADLVIWHTFGVTHFPRPEDWPVMPVDYAKFALIPYGFFDRNPALNVPANTPRHSGGPCCHSGEESPA
ncbi:primary-amine oxidase [Pseudofrankia sp. BMG5.37]|uniref:primary-amine oxidase n=1 Tax=Pseudofrankia sp. BMG5.37 TaxID=3050035 RepID=UPI0028946543|nr:primary-amine oxidase [Pseudofrankia sp. BMG5.37]MDT3438831.1 primary-amine oxidase [Pseudofrankia sp. BMG5.37]